MKSNVGSLGLLLLRYLKNRTNYSRIQGLDIPDTLEESALTLLDHYARIFSADKTVKNINRELYESWLDTHENDLKASERRVLLAVMDRAEEDPDSQQVNSIIPRLAGNMMHSHMLALCSDWDAGKEMDWEEEIQQARDAYNDIMVQFTDVPEVGQDISDVLLKDADGVGFTFPLGFLEDNLRPLRHEMVIFGARVDSGKTSLASNIAVHMAKQIEKVYPLKEYGKVRPILWFNNEGEGVRVMSRIYNVALGMKNTELHKVVSLNRTTPDSKTLQDMLNDELGGERKIIVMDVHGFNTSNIERLIRMYDPSVVIYDMIDNIQNSTGLRNGGERSDQQLEMLYQNARNMGIRYKHLVLAFSQSSGDAENVSYPELSMLKDSKTGKQGTAEAVIFMALNGKGHNTTRIFSAPKCKIYRDEHEIIRHSAVFDPPTGRFMTQAQATEKGIEGAGRRRRKASSNKVTGNKMTFTEKLEMIADRDEGDG